MTIWWSIAVIMAVIHILVSRWRDLGGAVVATFGVPLMMHDVFTPMMWGAISIGLCALCLGWWVSARRGIWRPRVNGISFFIAGACFPILAIVPVVLPNSSDHAVRLLLAVLCAFTASMALIFGLERPRPRPLRFAGHRRVPITTGQQQQRKSR